jgi:hypothetical protein
MDLTPMEAYEFLTQITPSADITTMNMKKTFRKLLKPQGLLTFTELRKLNGQILKCTTALTYPGTSTVDEDKAYSNLYNEDNGYFCILARALGLGYTERNGAYEY